MTPEQYSLIVRLGSKAEELLEDASFKDILVDLKQQAIRTWTETGLLDVTFREHCWHDLQAVLRLENHLKVLKQTKAAEQLKAEQAVRSAQRR